MSSRMLRKIRGDTDLQEPLSDLEGELEVPITGGVRRKQINLNKYDLLNQQSLSESEAKEGDNDTEAANAREDCYESVKRRKRKKKKKSGKHSTAQKSSEDNADVDEVERSVREVNRLLGNQSQSDLAQNCYVEKEGQQHLKLNLLNIQHKHLNPSSELKRMFGSKIIQSEHKRKSRGGRAHIRTTWLVSSKDHWPQAGKLGLSMSLSETKPGGLQYFNYEHSQNYRQVQIGFLEAVQTFNPDNIVSLINQYPYHIDGLIQLSDLCKLSEDLAMAAELIERALYSLECAFHPLFNLAQGKCRLEYKKQENRALYITLFKHLLFVGGRACYRTALELCKLILSLDPEGDPLAVKLMIDFYALRSKEYTWLIKFFNEFATEANLLQLPNFAFSIAVAHFYLSSDDFQQADMLLQDALLMFPGILKPLLDKCSISVDEHVLNHPYFRVKTEVQQTAALSQLILLYVNRCYYIWKEGDVMAWLERNVHQVFKKVEQNDPRVSDYEKKRSLRYVSPLPRSICRHIVISDIKGVSPLIEVYIMILEAPREITIRVHFRWILGKICKKKISWPVLSFDPFPPIDSINIYNKPGRPNAAHGTNSAVGVFFRSFLPSFNVNDIPERYLHVDEDGARALPAPAANADEGNDLRNSVASLVGAMRDLLSNVRLPDIPNDADVDENDSEEDEHNNYLT